MPHDRATQQSLGLFHGYPAWYRKYQIDNYGLGSRTQLSSSAQVQFRAPHQASLQSDSSVNATSNGTAGIPLGQDARGVAVGSALETDGWRPRPVTLSWQPQQAVQREGGGENRNSILERMMSAMGLASAGQPGDQSVEVIGSQPVVPFTAGQQYRPRLDYPSHESSLPSENITRDFGPIAPPSAPSAFTFSENATTKDAFPATPPRGFTTYQSSLVTIRDDDGGAHA
ncbi:hypothetical protein CMQ_591 [Grosmannia clavigera kw1407]|uniref:Uncharacterized protein n=1 Tax=Grosmannia clavigera (strain kw1407 / UAMH 11150) TaxID=655863 RepID=F0XFA5_GROCL|nr:uncharacterized protein CMQ_591 [Grosmannia clavigera kw1407]EFX03663.1 hypothetical protein CMQ_591 [Grosmannia clavigera kw1407]